jgi:hypothetical protein
LESVDGIEVFADLDEAVRVAEGIVRASIGANEVRWSRGTKGGFTTWEAWSADDDTMTEAGAVITCRGVRS